MYFLIDSKFDRLEHKQNYMVINLINFYYYYFGLKLIYWNNVLKRWKWKDGKEKKEKSQKKKIPINADKNIKRIGTPTRGDARLMSQFGVIGMILMLMKNNKRLSSFCFTRPLNSLSLSGANFSIISDPIVFDSK